MSTHLKFTEDHSDYDPSDSDEDYTENEKILLKKVRNRQTEESDDEDEVFGVGSYNDEEDSDDQSDIALSDVEGQEEGNQLPDVRAWGKDKRKFYSTDYVDPDYGGFQGKDAHLAELEEEEARNLQKQLAQQLDDDDFALDLPTTQEKVGNENIPEELIKSDISKLSKRQKLQILQKESPEFFGLVEDFQAKLKLVKEYLSPVLKKYKKGQIPNCSAIDFLTTQYELTLNYCVNIYMYLLLKASKVNVQNHPIIKRLYQYRQLLSQLNPVYEEIIEPQIKMLLEEHEEIGIPRKTLNILSKVEKQGKKKKADVEEQKSSKRVKFMEEIQEKYLSDSEEISKEQLIDLVEPLEKEAKDEVSRRAITYQIAKNKGLTPHRKKEQRNPRVKHRNKFRKAKIRRKGAVREPRTETTRYAGEISGIKANVVKSIKFKQKK